MINLLTNKVFVLSKNGSRRTLSPDTGQWSEVWSLTKRSWWLRWECGICHCECGTCQSLWRWWRCLRCMSSTKCGRRGRWRCRRAGRHWLPHWPGEMNGLKREVNNKIIIKRMTTEIKIIQNSPMASRISSKMISSPLTHHHQLQYKLIYIFHSKRGKTGNEREKKRDELIIEQTFFFN